MGQHTGGIARVTTLVNAPPEVSGSEAIKLRGLPSACAGSDFVLRASAKGAKKLKAGIRGPLNADANPVDGGISNSDDLAKAKGAKLSADVRVGDLEAAYHEIKLAAKYDSKPKQSKTVLFQVCP